MSEPVVRWAIKYVWEDGRESIDTDTLRFLRRDAWAAWEKDWLQPDGTVDKRAKARRRKRQVVAVRVRVEEV